MKLFTVEQIRAWDAYTIAHEPISSIDLMERAATAFTDWLLEHVRQPNGLTYVFCGTGNNGGDGLAIARQLHRAGWAMEVWVVPQGGTPSPDFETNRQRYEALGTAEYLDGVNPEILSKLSKEDLVIDALLGSGLNRPASGLLSDAIGAINASGAPVVAVDIASGLFADRPNGPDDPIVRPTHTVTFGVPKLALLQPKRAEFVGHWHVVDIGLSTQFAELTPSPYFFTDEKTVPQLPDREAFSHKGTFGHALLLAGSYGKIGAAVLAARACLRSGVGLLTVRVPRCGYGIVQTSVPEAMCLTDSDEEKLTRVPELKSYSALGLGPGWGRAPETARLLAELLDAAQEVPCVIDADALNLLSDQKELLEKLPGNAILTPHPKEFERLTQPWKDDFEKLDRLRDFCQRHGVYVVLKGQHTAVGTPEGEVHFNSTGNPGMATGGTGDALTGILTALLAQGIAPHDAAIFGVYQHGLAGDRAAQRRSQSAMTAGDLIEELGW
jgi:NAD(P)H-hydrate epimerase